MRNYSITRQGLVLILGLLWLVGAFSAAAEEYRIGSGDVLEINFWQDAQLDASVRVGLDGKITLDIIGQIEAAGKTTEQLQSDIVRYMSRLNKNISQAVVRVIEYNYNHVYITGAVTTPGKLTFEAIPDLWSIINEAGGATDLADLTRVTIIRGGDEAGKVETVNVSQMIATGSLSQLPKIRRMDTIEIPANPLGVPPSRLGQPLERKNVIYVIGAVTTPGPVTYEDNVDVLEAIALAGGPTLDANLKKASIVTKDGYYAQTMQMDLEKYATTGKPSRYNLRKEDVVVVPFERAGFFSGGLTTTVTVLGAITSAVIIYDRLSSDD